MLNKNTTAFETPQYALFVSNSEKDPEWDQFIYETADGHYTQTALWSEVKAVQGWSPLRLILKDEHGIMGGAQMLTRKLPLFGYMGYISKGPVCKDHSDAQNAALLQEIFKLCKQRHISYLAIQPPDHGNDMVDALVNMGMQKSTQGDLEKPATIIIDLRPDENNILSSIKPNKRKHIRSAEKQPFTYHEGQREELEIFNRLHAATGMRDHFEIQSKAFFEKLWDVFAPLGYAHLFIEELEGQPLIAKLSITYKDVFQNFRIGWSGEHKHQYPNEGITWFSMQWAKAHGYQYYDLSGIETKTAQLVLSNGSIPDELRGTYSEYKLHYSENVVMYPETYEKIFNPLLLAAYQLINFAPPVKKFVQRAYKRTRKR